MLTDAVVPRWQQEAHWKVAIIVGRLEGRSKGHAYHKGRAKQLLDINVSTEALMRLHNRLPDVAITKLFSPLLSQVCLSLNNITPPLGIPPSCADGERSLPAYCMPWDPCLQNASKT